MGRQVLEEQRPLPQPLAHQAKVQHLEVPEAAMDQLAGPAGRARRPVLRLHQAYRQPPGRGVEGGAGPGDATPHDQDVERSAGQAGDVRLAPPGRKGARLPQRQRAQWGPVTSTRSTARVRLGAGKQAVRKRAVRPERTLAGAARGEERTRMRDFVGAIDQGTTSTRFFVFDHDARVVARHQLEHGQVLPRPGWVEHDPLEILERVRTVMATALAQSGLAASDLAAIGITNQRETTVVWDRLTGLPYMNAIVWQDLRTDQIVSEIERRGRGATGPGENGAPSGDVFLGRQDPVDPRQRRTLPARPPQPGRPAPGPSTRWLLWNLTGGPRGGRHVTDVTNAARTMLMDLRSLSWDDELLAMFRVPHEILPEVRPSSGRSADISSKGRGRQACR